MRRGAALAAPAGSAASFFAGASCASAARQTNSGENHGSRMRRAPRPAAGGTIRTVERSRTRPRHATVAAMNARRLLLPLAAVVVAIAVWKFGFRGPAGVPACTWRTGTGADVTQ